MAGVKISKLKTYDEVFHDEHFEDFVNEMIVPVSLGNKPISVRVKELIRFINNLEDIQNERLDEQKDMILYNNDLINELAEATMQRMNEINENVEENEKVTALSLIDLNQITEEISLRLHNYKEQAEAEHQEMKEKQLEKDTEQDERIDNLDDSINLWEIYSSN